jgi:general secretion pathway protein B
MSYILEALKKAQAERQLGTAPSIHALPVHAGPAHAGSARGTPAWPALAGGTLVLAALAVVAWRQAAPLKPPAAPVQAVAPPALPVPAPVAVVPGPPPLAQAAPAPRVRKPVQAAPASEANKVAAVPAPAVTEEVVRTLRQLPEAIQRQVPPITIGGYIYSKEPADRLLLIDKILRHEGEEIAPGLTLEKLLPKAAVMNYKGFRYRVPY